MTRLQIPAAARRRLRFALAAYRSFRTFLPARARGAHALDIPSSLTEAETARLSEIARGKRVLEVGSWFGRSTIALATTAEIVHAVDWHQGDEHTGPLGTLGPFLRNLRRHGVRDRVVVHVGRIEDVAPALASEAFDVVFIDAYHTAEAVRRDTDLLLPRVRDGGVLAFHDYGRPEYGVTDVVRALADDPDVTDSVATVRVDADVRRRWAEASRPD